MITMQETSRAAGGMRPRQRCSHCGGPFGMVTHRWWGSKFCKRRCKEAYLREIMLDRSMIGRWWNSAPEQAVPSSSWAYATLRARTRPLI